MVMPPVFVVVFQFWLPVVVSEDTCVARFAQVAMDHVVCNQVCCVVPVVKVNAFRC